VISTGKLVLITALLTQNLNLSFLLDMQKGDALLTHGMVTLQDFSAANNELGNPVRDIVTGTLVTTVLIQVVLSYLVLLLMEQQIQ
jgi:hypothetical protein